ncbi:hypothetical protein K431DRAFT_84535 [Polychaeton citri CBS 116435]|uniref:Uncharacterized protein n=1 Tax=Polychaeton citri CBS 116435 TaxID=1314669 RepID=A0A9P4UQI1_9PEZI|nr:hypothetical protein K431DRAFT_84535 [Polychaeton citri CBS 116435]
MDPPMSMNLAKAGNRWSRSSANPSRPRSGAPTVVWILYISVSCIMLVLGTRQRLAHWTTAPTARPSKGHTAWNFRVGRLVSMFSRVGDSGQPNRFGRRKLAGEKVPTPQHLLPGCSPHEHGCCIFHFLAGMLD